MTTTRKRRSSTRCSSVALACCLLLGVLGLEAEEKTSGTQALGATSTSAKKKAKPRSLADFAAAAKLKSSTDAKGGKVTISNNSLASSSKSGTLSQGGGVTGAPAPTLSAPKPAADSDQQAALQQSYQEQLAKVKGIEGGLADFEAQVAQRDPRFNNTVQNRSPGVYSPNDQTRKTVNAELQAEKKKLDAIRSQAKRDGVELTNPE